MKRCKRDNIKLNKKLNNKQYIIKYKYETTGMKNTEVLKILLNKK